MSGEWLQVERISPLAAGCVAALAWRRFDYLFACSLIAYDLRLEVLICVMIVNTVTPGHTGWHMQLHRDCT